MIPGCQPGLKVFLYSQWELSGCTICSKHLVAGLQGCDVGLLLAWSLNTMHDKYRSALAYSVTAETSPQGRNGILLSPDSSEFDFCSRDDSYELQQMFQDERVTWLPACKPVT